MKPEQYLSQSFYFRGNQVYREIETQKGISIASLPKISSIDDAEKNFFIAYLGDQRIKVESPTQNRVTYIDVFCGGGGLSLGAFDALKMLGLSPKILAAVDTDNQALSLLKSKLKPLITKNSSIEDLVKYSVDLTGSIDDFVTQPTITDHQLLQFRGKTDLLIGGPPCRGHSTLNNRTRGNDPRNLLYFTMPALAVALKIPCVIIENVQSITRASENVVDITAAILRTHGYFVEEAVISALDFGTAQNRSRHFLIASKQARPQIEDAMGALGVKHLTFDEINPPNPQGLGSDEILEQTSVMSEENQRRINYLHDNDLFNLPNHERPLCHRDGHTYPSVYGRLKGDEPLHTITTGFGSPGRGRYIHPHERRVINAREAARAQAFPDWYWKGSGSLGFSRNNLYKIIGDAVPPLMVMPLMASLFETFAEDELVKAS